MTNLLIDDVHNPTYASAAARSATLEIRRNQSALIDFIRMD